jgi:hypothetical protein
MPVYGRIAIRPPLPTKSLKSWMLLYGRIAIRPPLPTMSLNLKCCCTGVLIYAHTLKKHRYVNRSQTRNSFVNRLWRIDIPPLLTKVNP